MSCAAQSTMDREFIAFKLEKTMLSNPDVVAFYQISEDEDDVLELAMIRKPGCNERRLREVWQEVQLYMNTAADNGVLARVSSKVTVGRIW